MIQLTHAERLSHGSVRPPLCVTAAMPRGEGAAYRRGGRPGAQPHIAPPLFQRHRYATDFPQYAVPLALLVQRPVVLLESVASASAAVCPEQLQLQLLPVLLLDEVWGRRLERDRADCPSSTSPFSDLLLQRSHTGQALLSWFISSWNLPPNREAAFERDRRRFVSGGTRGPQMNYSKRTFATVRTCPITCPIRNRSVIYAINSYRLDWRTTAAPRQYWHRSTATDSGLRLAFPQPENRRKINSILNASKITR
jgi:hypothetical protein